MSEEMIAVIEAEYEELVQKVKELESRLELAEDFLLEMWNLLKGESERGNVSATVYHQVQSMIYEVLEEISDIPF